MKLATRIFKRKDWYVTSPYGIRKHPITKKNGMHYGTDYGTHIKNWPLYALEEGKVLSVHYGNKGYGNYVWIKYPRLNIKLFYAHLDKICVKEKEKVTEKSLIGYTGKSGTATGIHLHLGIKKIGSNAWLNPHKYNYEEKENKRINNPKNIIYIVKKGDSLWSIAKKYYKDGKKYIKIAQKNNIKTPYTIYPNQKLIIP